MPLRTLDDSTQNFVAITRLPSPSPTSMKVKLPPMPSPFTRLNLSPGPSSYKGKPSLKGLLPRVSFKYRASTPDAEKASILSMGTPLNGTRERPPISRSFSLSKIFTPSMKSTSSLPVTETAHSNPDSVRGSTFEQLTPTKKEVQKHMSRSLSVPANGKTRGIRRMDSFGGMIRVIASTPWVAEGNGTTSNASPTVVAEHNEDGEDIPEEQAVCRICMIELGEGGDTLKMECNCKGELALAHEECAVKWFSLRGTKNCEVCKAEVRNLPVTLLRISSLQGTGTHTGTRARQIIDHRYRQAILYYLPYNSWSRTMESFDIMIWQDVPVLVIVGMLAYFCFLEQLLHCQVGKMGSGAIAIALPFSCVLGLLASMTASTMVKKRYVWIYASVQFALVVLFAHLFYSLLHVQPVLSVLLATFAGFGVAMCGNCGLIELLRWRRRWHDWLEYRRRTSQQVEQPAQASESFNQPSVSNGENSRSSALSAASPPPDGMYMV
ncbi:hypothetical protein ACLOJK_009319 [Asimina triloba]